MLVLKTLLLIFLNKWWRKSTGSQVPGYQGPISDLKPVHNLPYPWGLDSSTTSHRVKSAIYSSLPKAQTPLSSTHWNHLLYLPVLTSAWCKIFLWRIFYGGKGGEGGTPGQNKQSLLKHKSFPELFSLISTGFLESRDDRKQEQTYCLNKCLLTPVSTALSGSSRR